jgi:hypothetical protein
MQPGYPVVLLRFAIGTGLTVSGGGGDDDHSDGDAQCPRAGERGCKEEEHKDGAPDGGGQHRNTQG